MRIVFSGALVALVLAAVGSAQAACDVAGVDAAAVVAGRAAIDEACPCASAVSRAGYRRCATVAVRDRVVAHALPVGCRRDVLRHAKLSICGRPGAAVCCRVRPDGRTRHGVVADPASCVDTATFSTCVSTWQSVPLGCDASGCVPPPVCGNAVVEPGEECDPPDQLYCDLACRKITCDLPPTLCGNGVVDVGEACDPPGVGDCASDCQPAGCAAPAPGVTPIACVMPVQPYPYYPRTTVGAAASPGGYMIAWNGPHRRADAADVVARRFDADLAAVDSGVTIVSDGAPCGTQHGSATIGSDGAQYFVEWGAYGNLSDGGPLFELIDGRRLGVVAGEQPIEQFAYNVPVGFCRTDIGAPMIPQAISASRFAIGYRQTYYCSGASAALYNPVGRIVDYNPGAVVPPVSLGFPLTPPTIYSASGAGVAVFGGDVLWTWHVYDDTNFPPTDIPGIVAAWTDATGTTAATMLTTRGPYVVTPPAASAGTASILVAWSQNAGPDPTAYPDEIRMLRTTRAGGNLDPDGGLPVATAATGADMTDGPVAAFDGSRWLVAWIETTFTFPYPDIVTSELRAAAVAEDGTVLDAAPRVLASDVSSVALASRGDGRVLVVFGQRSFNRTAVRAMFVTP